MLLSYEKLWRGGFIIPSRAWTFMWANLFYARRRHCCCFTIQSIIQKIWKLWSSMFRHVYSHKHLITLDVNFNGISQSSFSLFFSSLLSLLCVTIQGKRLKTKSSSLKVTVGNKFEWKPHANRVEKFKILINGFIIIPRAVICHFLRDYRGSVYLWL